MTEDVFHKLAAQEIAREEEHRKERFRKERADSLRSRGRMNGTGVDLPKSLDECRQQLEAAIDSYLSRGGEGRLGRIHDLVGRIQVLEELHS
jgi:hypothetical protein